MKNANGLKKIIKVNLRRRVFNEEESAPKTETCSLTGGQMAWMIHKFFTTRNTDVSVPEGNEILKVELKEDNVQSSITKWDETCIITRKLSDRNANRYCLCTSGTQFIRVS